MQRYQSGLATITEAIEPGQPLEPDALESCSSRMTSLSLTDPQPKSRVLGMANPIRLYAGYKTS